MRYVNCIVVVCVLFCLIPAVVLAGDLEAPAGPTDAGSAMNTLEDIYNIINDGTTHAPRIGAFAEPSAGPASTGHTLTEVYNQAKTSSRPAKTGQITSYATGDDGDLEKGVAWPSPRFTAATDTVTDNLTGLMWAKNANAGGQKTWANALTYCNGLTLGGHEDWRLPNRFELESLLDLAYFSPALSNDAGTGQWTSGGGSSFTGVQSDQDSDYYWSSTTFAQYTDYAWSVGLFSGNVDWVGNESGKSQTLYVWPVRGGQ